MLVEENRGFNLAMSSSISGVSGMNLMNTSADKSSDKTPNKFRISESEIINED